MLIVGWHQQSYTLWTSLPIYDNGRFNERNSDLLSLILQVENHYTFS